MHREWYATVYKSMSIYIQIWGVLRIGFLFAVQKWELQYKSEFCLFDLIYFIPELTNVPSVCGVTTSCALCIAWQPYPLWSIGCLKRRPGARSHSSSCHLDDGVYKFVQQSSPLLAWTDDIRVLWDDMQVETTAHLLRFRKLKKITRRRKLHLSWYKILDLLARNGNMASIFPCALILRQITAVRLTNLKKSLTFSIEQHKGNFINVNGM